MILLRRFYHIVVYEHTTPSTNFKEPWQYTLNELGAYSAATHQSGTPYITAEISDASFVSKFIIGDGKDYSKSSRKRRNAEAVKYTNVALKPNTQYYVFQRSFISDVSTNLSHFPCHRTSSFKSVHRFGYA